MSLKRIKQLIGKRYKILKWYIYYLKQLTFVSQKGKPQIIVCFDGLFPHGGLVDRLKGIVSLYQISKKLNYDFKIIFDTPFELDLFLEPNFVDWKLNKTEVKFNPLEIKLLYLVNNFNENPFLKIKKSKAKRFYVYANIDYGNKTFPDMDQFELENCWRRDFNFLFKKSKMLNSKLESIDKSEYIAFHSRFTSIMGDFVDSTSISISEEQRAQLVKQLLVIIKRVKHQSSLPVYIFSDSINFINEIKSKTNVNVIEGNPFHLENYSGKSTIEAHLKTLIDFFMLSKSNTIYFLKIGNMYQSSFSKYASIVGNTKFYTLSK